MIERGEKTEVRGRESRGKSLGGKAKGQDEGRDFRGRRICVDTLATLNPVPPTDLPRPLALADVELSFRLHP